MARKIYRGYARDGNGTVLSGATVSVYLTGTSTVASIYTASTGGTAVNSVATDSTGLYSFYVDYSDYAAGTQFRLTISKTGYDSVTYDEVECLPQTVSDAEYDATWDGVTTIGPSKNAVYDAFQLYLPLAGGTMSGSLDISAGNSLSVGDSYIDHILEKTAAHGVAIDGLTIKDGNIVLSGGQIAFPATANPSTNANTLDDYEEGGWTPALKFGGNADGMAYGVQWGVYTKIGRLLHLFAVIILTAKGTSTGSATITGLPFPINSNSEPVTLFVDTITFGGTMEGSAAGTTVSLCDISEAGGLGYITNADFADTSALRISIITFV